MYHIIVYFNPFLYVLFLAKESYYLFRKNDRNKSPMELMTCFRNMFFRSETVCYKQVRKYDFFFRKYEQFKNTNYLLRKYDLFIQKYGFIFICFQNMKFRSQM